MCTASICIKKRRPKDQSTLEILTLLAVAPRHTLESETIFSKSHYGICAQLLHVDSRETHLEQILRTREYKIKERFFRIVYKLRQEGMIEAYNPHSRTSITLTRKGCRFVQKTVSKEVFEKMKDVIGVKKIPLSCYSISNI